MHHATSWSRWTALKFHRRGICKKFSHALYNENLKTKIDTRNTDEELVQYSLICSSKSFQIVNDEFRQAGKTPFITEDEDSYKVKGELCDKSLEWMHLPLLR